MRLQMSLVATTCLQQSNAVFSSANKQAGCLVCNHSQSASVASQLARRANSWQK